MIVAYHLLCSHVLENPPGKILTSARAQHAVRMQCVALTTAIGVLKGTANEAFAIGLVFSVVVRTWRYNKGFCIGAIGCFQPSWYGYH